MLRRGVVDRVVSCVAGGFCAFPKLDLWASGELHTPAFFLHLKLAPADLCVFYVKLGARECFCWRQESGRAEGQARMLMFHPPKGVCVCFVLFLISIDGADRRVLVRGNIDRSIAVYPVYVWRRDRKV